MFLHFVKFKCNLKMFFTITSRVYILSITTDIKILLDGDKRLKKPSALEGDLRAKMNE